VDNRLRTSSKPGNSAKVGATQQVGSPMLGVGDDVMTIDGSLRVVCDDGVWFRTVDARTDSALHQPRHHTWYYHQRRKLDSIVQQREGSFLPLF